MLRCSNYYLTRAVSSPTSDLGKEVVAAVCRVACLVLLSCPGFPGLLREYAGHIVIPPLQMVNKPGFSYNHLTKAVCNKARIIIAKCMSVCLLSTCHRITDGDIDIWQR